MFSGEPTRTTLGEVSFADTKIGVTANIMHRQASTQLHLVNGNTDLPFTPFKQNVIIICNYIYFFILVLAIFYISY